MTRHAITFALLAVLGCNVPIQRKSAPVKEQPLGVCVSGCGTIAGEVGKTDLVKMRTPPPKQTTKKKQTAKMDVIEWRTASNICEWKEYRKSIGLTPRVEPATQTPLPAAKERA